MSALITSGAIVIEPHAIEGYESARESRNLVHSVPGRPSADVTLRPAGLRTGALKVRFLTESAGQAADNAHALPVVFTIRDSETLVLAEMYYIVVEGGARLSLDSDSDQWVLVVPFQEIVP